MLRTLDLVLAAVGLFVCLPVCALIILVAFADTGSPLFRQVRVGRHQKTFTVFKFRTMHLQTPVAPTHLTSPVAVTKIGRFLRTTKLDELPQLWNVLKGEMSLVGPRPCLLDQHELITERALRGVFTARPGITGLAQITNIDMSTPLLLAQTDALMLQNLNTFSYFSYLFKTLFGAGRGDRIRWK